MMGTMRGLIAGALLLGVAPLAADASDPTEPHRWHMPRRGARELARGVVAPVHAEWNQLGHLVNDGKAALGDFVAIGVAWSDPSPAEGSGDETLIEFFDRVHLAKAISLTPDLQLVFDQANNPGDEVVVAGGIRLLLEF
jgi:hypothetical protein